MSEISLEGNEKYDLLQAHVVLITRYSKILTPDVIKGADDLLTISRMCDKIISDFETPYCDLMNWPIDKVARWVGFIQGVLFMWGLIDIEEERDFSRPIFQEVYIKHGTGFHTISV